MHRRRRPLLFWALALIAGVLTQVAGRSSAEIQSRRVLPSPSAQIQRAAAFDGHDGRETFESYAASHHMDVKDVLRASAATGQLVCKSKRGSASITLAANVLTTAAHILCEARARPSDCSFTYTYNDSSKTIKVLDGTTPFDCRHYPSADDWAVLTLEQPAIGPSPLSIDPRLVESTSEGEKVVLIADHSIDFCKRSSDQKCLREAGSSAPILPRYIEDCRVRYIGDTNDIPSQFVNDCASSSGASGGAILGGPLDHPVLLAIQVSGPETTRDAAYERRTGMPVVKPYSLTRGWYMAANPIDGAFAQAIRKAASAKPHARESR